MPNGLKLIRLLLDLSRLLKELSVSPSLAFPYTRSNCPLSIAQGHGFFQDRIGKSSNGRGGPRSLRLSLAFLTVRRYEVEVGEVQGPLDFPWLTKLYFFLNVIQSYVEKKNE